MTKKKLLETLIEGIRKKWENATVREMVYLISYVGAVAVSYKILMATKGIIVSVFVTGDWFQRLLLGTPPWEEPGEWLKGLDLQVFLTSLTVAYMVLKIDVDDIVTASKQIGILAGKLE